MLFERHNLYVLVSIKKKIPSQKWVVLKFIQFYENLYSMDQSHLCLVILQVICVINDKGIQIKNCY